MRKNKHRRFIPAVEYLREPILLEAERATELPLRLTLFHLTSQADRNGVVPLNYEDIEARAPGDDLDWERVIDLLGAAGFLTIFGAGDGLAADNSLPGYIQLSGWHRMQTPHDKEKTDLPAPPDLNRYLTPQKLDWKPWQRAVGTTGLEITIREATVADQLFHAAAGNVSTSAVDITPILDLIEAGIPLESILQSVRNWVASDATKLNSWGEGWLITAIQTDWQVRPAAQQHPDDASAKAPESREGRSGASTPASHSTGFFANLTPEQQKAALAYRGPENIGPPDAPRLQSGTQIAEGFTLTGEIQPIGPAPRYRLLPTQRQADGKMYADPAFYDEPPPHLNLGDHHLQGPNAPPIPNPKEVTATPQPPADPVPEEPQGFVYHGLSHFKPSPPSDYHQADQPIIPPKDTAEGAGPLSGVSLPLISPAGVPWSDLLDGYMAGNLAWDAAWGPKPGQPGSLVPVELAEEYGFKRASVPLVERP